MSKDEINRDLRKLAESGKLTGAVMREAINHPIEGEKIIRLDRIEEQVGSIATENKRQSFALFGDLHLPGGVNAGLVKDVRGLKLIIFKAVWAISGVVSFCTLLLTLLGIYIEWSKH